MQKLKKLLIILTCLALAGCSNLPTANNSINDEYIKKEIDSMQSNNQTSGEESVPQSSDKTSSLESENITSSNTSSVKKYTTRLGELLIGSKSLSETNWKEITESNEILQVIRKEMDIDFSQIDNCVGKALYIKQNSPYNYYGALSAPKDQYQKIQSMLEAIPHNGDRPHSWNMTKNPKYGKDYFEYNLIVGRECLRYSRWDYRQEPKYFVDQLFLIPQGTEIIIYILRDQGWIN